MSGDPQSVVLAPLTTLRLGGPAARLVRASSAQELADAVRAADTAGEPLLLLAGGSNVVIADEGFAGTVVHIVSRGVVIEDGEGGRVRVTAQAGEPWDDLVAQLIAAGISGVEALSGIPGSAGATPVQNVGAYGAEAADVLHSVRAFDREAGAIVDLPAAQCGLGYRTSRFKGSDRFVVLEVAFDLERAPQSAPIRYAELAATLGVELGASAPAAAVRDAVLGLRRSKGMVLDAADHDTWSAGSFFTNPIVAASLAEDVRARAPQGFRPLAAWPTDRGVKLSAAWLIEAAGITRGAAEGGAAISSKHALALTNRGTATTADLLRLAHRVADAVEDRFGVALVPEPVLVGVSWAR